LFTNKDSLGALNPYSPQRRSFDAETRGEGLAFAAQAAVALRSARDKEDLRVAMATRNLIGQAQGILMEQYQMTAEQAFAVLVKSPGVVVDGYRVIFMSGQAPSAGMVGWVGTSSVALAVSGTGRRRQRARTSRPR
jgi:ANTAR domain